MKIKTVAILGKVLLFLALVHLELAGASEPGGNEYLDMDIAELMQVMVTSASKRAQNLADVPSAIFVISQEDIRRSGVRTLPEALAMAPGIQVARISASKWSISSRGFPGFSSNKLLVMIDGRTIYSPMYAGSVWDSQNTMLEDVDRIEVIRGPGATVWGANAVNGIINVITKHAKETQGGLVTAGWGGEGAWTGGARYGAKIGEVTYGRLYLNALHEPSNQLWAGGVDGQDGWQPTQGGFRLDGNPNRRDEWTLQGDILENREDMLISPYWVDRYPYRLALAEEPTIQRSNLLGRWRRGLGDGRSFTVQGYFDYIKYSLEQDGFCQQLSTSDVDVQYEGPLGPRQHMTMGMGYRSTQSDYRSTQMLAFPDHRGTIFNTFLQDEITFVPETLVLTLGSKYESNEYTGNEWQPSIKLLWKPQKRHSLWASVAKAVRTPNILERSGRVLSAIYPDPTTGGLGTAAMVGNPNFDAESLWAYEVGYRWQPTDTLLFDLTAFYNDYDDLYAFRPLVAPAQVAYQFVNGLTAKGTGFEAAIDWKARPWLSFVATYSYLHLDFAPKDSGYANLADYFAEESPKHQASLRTAISLAQNWQLNLWAHYVDSIVGNTGNDPFNTSELRIDSSLTFDANLIWTPHKNLEVMFAGQDILDSGHLQYTMEYMVPPTVVGRSVYGKIIWRF